MSTRLRMIQRFKTEQELRDKLLEPLFERMGFETYKTHGANEFGKDFVLAKKDELGIRRLTSVVVKKGSIGVGSTEKEKSAIESISRQVRQSFEVAYPDAISKEHLKVQRVFFVCDGTISDNAKRVIAEQWGVSRELYEKNTEFIPGEKLVELTGQHWALFFTSSEPELTEYAEQLLIKLERDEKTRSINIDSRIAATCNKYLESSLFEVSPGTNGQLKHVSKEPDKVFKTVGRILIVGESGAGKSFLLREQLKKIIERENDQPRIKLYCRLADLADVPTSAERLAEFCISQIQKIAPKVSSSYLVPFLREQKIDFYLDGFDEIGTEDKRVSAIDNINSLISTYPQSQFVVTTRALDIALKQGLPNSFHRYDIKQLSYKESIHYLEAIVKEASSCCSEIMKEIKHQGLMLSLPRTPLTLQLIGSLFSENAAKEIPSNITEVYKMYSEIMLGRWDKQRDVTNTFDYERKVSLLGELALYMQNQFIEEMIVPRAIELTEAFLSDMGDEPTKAMKLLEEIIKRSEILTLSNADHIRFKHRSFQEFFTAHKMHTQGHDFKVISGKIYDPWWENVIIFLCGFRKNADDIVDYVIDLLCPDELEEALFRFRRGKNLGMMVRAGYESTVEMKKKAIKASLYDFESCYKSDYIENQIKTILGRLPKYALHVVFQMIFSHAYYSKLTRKPVLELVTDIESPLQRSFLGHLIVEFEAFDDAKRTLDWIRQNADLDSKKACVIVMEQAQERDTKKETKLLESKEFRKLKKSAGTALGQRKLPAGKKQK